MQPTIQGRRRSAVLPILLLAALLASMPLPAQEPTCRLSDTVGKCLDRYRDWVTDQERQDLMKQPTGIDTGGANLATNTKDLLPRTASRPPWVASLPSLLL